MSLPPIAKTAAVAAELGVDRSTLWRWTLTDVRLGACVLRRTRRSLWFSTQRLRDAGFLEREAPVAAAPAHAVPALTTAWRAAL